MPRKAKPIPLMTTVQAAAHLNISKSKLEKMRGRPGGPPVVEIDKSRRYRQSDLDEWVAKQVVTSAQSRRPRPRRR